jgi:hypothetical protein
VAVLEPTVYGGYKDVNEAGMAGVLPMGDGAVAIDGPKPASAARRTAERGAARSGPAAQDGRGEGRQGVPWSESCGGLKRDVKPSTG